MQAGNGGDSYVGLMVTVGGEVDVGRFVTVQALMSSTVGV